ncbi:MAG: hypothetical protein Q9206_001642 [Seirophora lacunosa]
MDLKTIRKPSQIFWSRASSSNLAMPPGVWSFGISFLERSAEIITDRDFLVTALEVEENIYYEHNNFSELVTNYTWDISSYSPLVISAVERGREEGLPITFNYGALVRFVRWLGQVSKAHKWQRFRCYFGWVEEGKPKEFLVGEGNFTAFVPTAGPPSLSSPSS